MSCIYSENILVKFVYGVLEDCDLNKTGNKTKIKLHLLNRKNMNFKVGVNQIGCNG